MITRRKPNPSRTTLRFILLLALLTFGLSFDSAERGAAVGDIIVTNCTESGLDAALSQGGTISFQCGGASTITITGKKEITQATTIDGSNNGFPVVISGSGTHRLFDIKDNVYFELKHLVLTGGHEQDGGAIHNRGKLVIDNVEFNNNTATRDGGAIFSENKATVNSQEFPV